MATGMATWRAPLPARSRTSRISSVAYALEERASDAKTARARRLLSRWRLSRCDEMGHPTKNRLSMVSGDALRFERGVSPMAGNRTWPRPVCGALSFGVSAEWAIAEVHVAPRAFLRPDRKARGGRISTAICNRRVVRVTLPVAAGAKRRTLQRAGMQGGSNAVEFPRWPTRGRPARNGAPGLLVDVRDRPLQSPAGCR